MLSLNDPLSARVSHKHRMGNVLIQYKSVLIIIIVYGSFLPPISKGLFFLGNYCACNVATEINGHEALN